jgi:hypothetical protein
LTETEFREWKSESQKWETVESDDS